MADQDGTRDPELDQAVSHARLLHDVVESAADVAFQGSNDGVVEWTSDSVELLLGRTPGDLVGTRFLDLVHPDDRSDVVVAQSRVAAGDERRFEARIETTSGWRWMSILVRPLLDADGHVVGRAGGWRDVHEERLARDAVDNAYERYRLLAESTSDVVVTYDADFRIEWVSPSVTRVLGYEPTDVLGTKTSWIHPEDRDLAMQVFSRAISSGQSNVRTRVRLLTARGSIRWFDSSMDLVRDAHGVVNRVIASLRDISSEVDAFTALESSRQELAVAYARRGAVLDSLLDPLLVLEAVRDDGGAVVDFSYVLTSASAEEFFGLEPDRLRGGSMLTLFPAQRGSGMFDLFVQVMESEQAVSLDGVVLPNTRTGTDRRYDVHVVPAPDGVSVTWRDVTERSERQERLREAEERYRTLAESSSDVVLLTGPDRTITWASPSVRGQLGWEPEEIVGRRVSDLLAPRALDAAMTSFSGPVAAGVASATVELCFRTADGGTRWMSVLGTAIRDDDGAIVGGVDALRDIQAQVEARDALAASEALYRGMAASLHDGVVIQVAQQGIVRANAAAESILGLSLDQMMGRTSTHPAWRAVHEDGSPFPGEGHPATITLATGRPTRGVVMGVHKPDGALTWILVNSEPLAGLPEFPGRPAVVTSFTDITELKNEQLATAAAEARYRLLAENSADFVLQIGSDARIHWVSPSVTLLLGYDAEEWLGRTRYDLIHPDDLDGLRGAVAQCLATASSVSVEARIRHRDGRYVWWDMTGRPHPDGGIVVAARDIDATKRAQDAAKEAQRLRTAASEAMLDPNVLVEAVRDEAGRIVDLVYVECNDPACRYFRRPHADLVGTRMLTIQPSLAGSPLFAGFVQTLVTGDPLVLESVTTPSDVQGGPRSFDVRAVRVDGDLLALTWRDVTDRVADARRVAESEERYRLLAENSTDVVLRLREGVVVWASPSLTDVLGWEVGDWVGRPVVEFLHPEDGHEVRRVGAPEPSVVRVRVRSAAGDHHWVEGRGRPYLDATGTPDGRIVSLRVIDDEVAAAEALHARATHDDLTGLLSRAETIDRLASVLDHAPRTGVRTAVAFCDVDDFKAVNDTHGHGAGDEALRVLAGRINALVREGDHVARFGGDEILVVLDGIDDLASAQRIAETFRQQARMPIPILGGSFQVTLSVGVTLAAPHEDVDALIARADAAMYAAKESGKDRVVAI